jgi:hypothetical protein
MITTLAAAYAESGDFEHAIKYQKSAVGMSNGKYRTWAKTLLDDYENHRPYHRNGTRD